MVTRTLYPSGTQYSQSYSTTHSREIDLRKEFDEIVFGGPNSIPHGRKLLFRKMRRDSGGALLPCSCVDSLTKEPDTESDCPYCLGAGAYWDEDWLTGFASYIGADGGLSGRQKYLFPGPIRVDYRVFYIRYDTDITYDDYIVELQLDTEGDPVVPYKRETIYKPQTINKYRSDRGRIEYIAVYCREEDALRPE